MADERLVLTLKVFKQADSSYRASISAPSGRAKIRDLAKSDITATTAVDAARKSLDIIEAKAQRSFGTLGRESHDYKVASRLV